MIDVTAAEAISNDARVRSNVARLAAAQALTGANSAVIFATGSIIGAELAPDISLAGQRPAEFSFSRHVETKLTEIRAAKSRPEKAAVAS